MENSIRLFSHFLFTQNIYQECTDYYMTLSQVTFDLKIIFSSIAVYRYVYTSESSQLTSVWNLKSKEPFSFGHNFR